MKTGRSKWPSRVKGEGLWPITCCDCGFELPDLSDRAINGVGLRPLAC